MTAQAWKVALSETTLGEEEALAAAEVVRSGWLTQGARVQAFERAFADFVGVPHAIAVANCTVGLEIAFQCAGVKAGDEVIVPALTFVATANAASRLGAKPVFADIRSEHDLTLDPTDVARKMTSKTRAIAPVHYGGWPADMPALRTLAATHGVAIVEDCAHAPGARTAEGACGALGDVGAFSFFSNKNMATGEGGMLTTTRDDVAEHARLLRSHGMTTTTWDRHRGHAYTYDVAAVGTNARMDEIRAAIGTIQLRKLAEGNAVRAARVEQYRARLGEFSGLEIPFATRAIHESAHHLFVVLLPPEVDRLAVMAAMREHGIQTSIHYPPTHRFSAYGADETTLAVTDRVAARILTLPLFSTMTEAQVDLVCDALRASVK
jgi:dTDP-4-amino-4,6-dideoxygalactose transaminase